jgi:hypothetical protein
MLFAAANRFSLPAAGLSVACLAQTGAGTGFRVTILAIYFQFKSILKLSLSRAYLE